MPVSIAGTVPVSFNQQISVNNFPAVQAVSASSPSGFWFTGGVAVSGTVGVNNFPATQNVSGTVTAIVGNWPATFGVTASAQIPVFNTGPVGVSGTVAITTSGPIQVWTEGAFGVSASVQLPVYSTGLVGVSGTVGVNNFPATQNVSGTVTAIIGNWPATIGVTASAQIPVFNTGPVGVSGTVAITSAGPLQVWTEGAFGVTGSVNVYTSGPQAVSASSPSGFWSTGNQGVTGSVNVYTSGPQAVSGTYQSGSVATAPVFPVLEGGLDRTNTVRPFLTDPQGRLTNPTTGSNVTTVAASTANATALFPNSNRVGAIFFNEGSSTAFLKFGIGATQVNYTVQLGAKAYYELPFTYQGQVDVIFSTNTGNLRVTELT